jgi:hypothetical protein
VLQQFLELEQYSLTDYTPVPTSQPTKMARHPARQAYVEEEMEMVRLPHPVGETDVHAHSERWLPSRLEYWNDWLMDGLVGFAGR